MSKDPMGDILKEYEKVETGRKISAESPIVVRIDGRSFSNFTRGMKRPFDEKMSDIMIEVTKYLVKETHAVVGYTQSDEMTLILYKERDDNSLAEHMFDGRIQKLTSVIAGLASSKFSLLALKEWEDLVENKVPVFDCRVFQVPSLEVAMDVLGWREMDARKNSVSMLSRAFFSHKQLDGKSSVEMKEMLSEKGVNYYSYPEKFRRGTYVQRKNILKELSLEELDRIPIDKRPSGPILRSEVMVMNVPAFRRIENPVDVFVYGKDVIVRSDDEIEETNEVGMRL